MNCRFSLGSVVFNGVLSSRSEEEAGSEREAPDLSLDLYSNPHRIWLRTQRLRSWIRVVEMRFL